MNRPVVPPVVPSSTTTPLSADQLAQLDVLQERYARRISAQLHALTEQDIDPVVSERLRAARERALAARKLAPAAAEATLSQGSGQLALGGGWGWARRLAVFVLPAVLALVAAQWLLQVPSRAPEALPAALALADARGDAEILTNDLPPTAYADQAFLAYLEQSDQQTGMQAAAFRAAPK